MSERDDKRQKRLATFRALVQERIVQLNASWVQLEHGVSDRDVASGLLGELHTLKGEASLMGFMAVSNVAHALEDLIGSVIEEEIAPTCSVRDLVLEAFDLILALSESDPGAPAPDADELVARLRGDDASEPPPAPHGDAPDPAPAEPAAPDAVEMDMLPDGEGVPAAPTLTPGDTPRKPTSYSVRVNPKQLDQIRDIIGELLLTRTRLASSAAALHRQRHGDDSDDAGEQADLSEALRAPGRDDLLRSVESQLRDDVLRMSNLVNALDEATRDLRMVSISVIFERYPVWVRTMSRGAGRQVQLLCEGEDVEADRDVLEALNDPLLHLVNNALSHGIEPPAVRRSRGKPDVGTLALQASVINDMLRLEVKDDGAGIDVQVVKAKAIERGLVDPGTARTMTDRQVLRCLFEPHMSTRSTVDQIAGRGIGLDVVQKTVRNLGGTVEVVSELGVGTTFQLNVPIRASITSVLLFYVGRGRYALPTNMLVALEELEDYPISASIDGPALQYKEGMVPLIPLEPVLGEPPLATEGKSRGARVIITRHGSMLIGLTGSHSHLQREAVLKPLGPMLRDDKIITAGLALEDGSVALVINPGEVFRVARGVVEDDVDITPAMPAREELRAPQTRSTVLVAEDSPIVRDLVVDALRVHGVNVIEAVDGLDAIEQLARHPEIELLVTDVEMPRLDGLGLIKRMRAMGGRRVPAVVVSTRGSDADKQAAVEVGADAYLVKSDFTREGLWALVSRFLA